MQTDVSLNVRDNRRHYELGGSHALVQGLQTNFHSKYYLYFDSYIYCICTFITNIYVASSSLCTLYRQINIVMCQVTATSFIHSMVVTVNKEFSGNNAQTRFLRWWVEVQKRCKQLSYVLKNINITDNF